MTKMFFLFALLLPAAVFAATDAPLPLSLNRDWTLFLGVEAPVSFAAVPATLPGVAGAVKAQRVTLKDNAVNLGQLAGGFKEQDCAILYNQFDCPAAGTMRAGFAADWWLEIYLNGEKVFSNLALGNGSQGFSPDDQVIDLPVKAGCNLLAAKVLSGSKGWRFVCGVPSRAPGLLTIRSGAQWKPLDMNRLQVKPGTALDFSTLAGVRRPAGGLGRVVIRPDGRLAFEKDVAHPVRLFGYNSGFAPDLVDWSDEEIETFAGAMARQGYNAHRLQLLEYLLTGGWQARLADPAAAFAAGKLPFDDKAFNKFDWFFHCLKKNGIYVNLDLMNGGGYFGYSTKLPPEGAFKTRLLFSPRHRQRWAAAIAVLLNHRNPYTGLCLKDDPALVCVEPFNEQDILLFDQERMREFTPPFRRYLQDKYRTDAALAAAWGQVGLTFASVPGIDEDMLRRADTRAGDAGAFLIKTMSDANAWYFKTLRENGYPGLVSQWDMIMRTLEMPVRAMMPVIAQHAYFAHPWLVPTKHLVPKSANNAYFWNSIDTDIGVDLNSSLDSSYFRAAAAVRFLDRPFLMTEYSHSFPARYRHERGLFYGAYAALQGWDGLFAHGCLVSPPRLSGRPMFGFEGWNDPVARASEVVAALAWLRGDVQEAPHTVQITLSGPALFPRHLLSAIGDDYAKLAMLTRIGSVYQGVKPLAPVGQAKPDLEFVPTEFAPLNVHHWYASASNQDGTVFPSLVRKLQAARILPPSNQTDASRRVYQSETGEIRLNASTRAEETMQVVTSRFEGAILKKNQPVRLGSVAIASCSRPASVVVASLDPGGNRIAESRHLLLVLATNAANSGQVFEDSTMYLMVELGHQPVLVETAQLTLSVKTAATGMPLVYPLHLDGTRMSPVPARVENGTLLLSLDTSALPCGTVFFEIMFP